MPKSNGASSPHIEIDMQLQNGALFPLAEAAPGRGMGSGPLPARRHLAKQAPEALLLPASEHMSSYRAFASCSAISRSAAFSERCFTYHLPTTY